MSVSKLQCKSNMEWENIGVGGKSAFSSLKKMISNLAGEFACEIESKDEHLGCFETLQLFSYGISKSQKGAPKYSRNAKRHSKMEK